MRATLRVLAVFGAFAIACVALRHVDIATMGGGFKGDEATYVGLAASAGFDRDLTYGPRDYQRFREWYGGGPQGIFLRRGNDGQLYFGKAFLYGVLAAPFALAGGLGGLLVFNFACFALLLAGGYFWLRPGSRPAAALAFTLVFLAASIAPLYAFWLTSDALNFALVFLAFAVAVAPPGEPPRPCNRGAGLCPARRGDLLQAAESPSCLTACDGRTRRSSWCRQRERLPPLALPSSSFSPSTPE